MDINGLYQVFLRASGVTTDSRRIWPNQLFFALKGETFNGNAYAQQALQDGAAFAVIDDPQYQSEGTILVDDVLKALQQLALYHRRIIEPMAVIAITGSNGKTTTKELVHAVLSTTYQAHYTKGNLNNHIGIPLTLLDMPVDTSIAVIEMGANHQKEIASYCEYTEPTHGIITNCGKAHLEGFGGEAGIRKGKGELYDYLAAHHGTVFVNGDDDTLLDMLKERNISNAITYGQWPFSQYGGKIMVEQPYLQIEIEGTLIHTHLYGKYNYPNIMCAIAVGKHFGIENDRIKTALENYVPSNSRSQVVEKNGYTVIMDAYNANPTSMQLALENFAAGSSPHKVVILGDMFELGDFSKKEHQKIADLCTDLGFGTIVLVGSAFAATKTNDTVLKFPDAESAKEWFSKQDFTGAEILLKGSRSMKMEKVVS